ncbi:MAG TPA: CYTH and CHAD domain-containing protein [Marmoricola sp.]|nr:CYTH and CHAD domain-containing protein [Marmoricola sp.]
MDTVLEIETKFEVGPTAVLPDLSSLPTVSSVDPAVDEDLTAIYFDTPALALLHAHVTLRRRTGGHDAGWHLKLPAHDDRYELQEPLGDPAEIPRRMLEVIYGLTRGESPQEIATLHTHRCLTRLRAAAGPVVATICDDRVEANSAGSASTSRWREWELELTMPNPALAEAGAELLRSAGARNSTAPSKLSRALSLTPALETKQPPISSRTVVADVLGPYLAEQAARLAQLDPLVRADLPDAVHQMRVTARRLRAVLVGFDREFVAGRTARLRNDLGWLASELGRARDLEVLRERIATTAGENRGELAGIDAELAESHEHAHDDAVAAMASTRYFGLLDALAAFTADPPWGERAKTSADSELTDRLQRLWRRMNRAVHELDDNSDIERTVRLHEIRRMAKRLRYCTEATEPLLGSRARDLAHSLSDLQDTLGRHHDAVLADRMIEAMNDNRDAASVAGATRQRLRIDALDDDRRAVRMLHRIRRRHEYRWLR